VTKTYRGALLLALVIVLLVPTTAAAATVPAGVTKGLDYLHTRQRADGGFSYSSGNGSAADTPWVMLAIASGRNNPARWRSHGRSPVTYLQSINLTAAATDSGNAPEFYALCIVAYRAADRTDLLTSAGSTQIDLVDKLESYQSTTGPFYSPTGSSVDSVETTAWAILGLHAALQGDAQHVGDAVTWLAGQANTTAGDAGGFGSSPGSQSGTTVTSLAAQALVAGKTAVSSAPVQNAIAFIATMQRSDGGFADTSDGFVNAQSTAWAIEAFHAAGLDPQKLVVNGHTPASFLSSLRQSNGSYHDYPKDLGDVMGATIQASFALGGRTLASGPAINHLTRFAPSFTPGSIAPKNGARLASRTALIEAGYADNVNGTGIDPKAIRIVVNSRSKRAAAHLTSSHLSLQLTKLANGTYTWAILVRDWAGNTVRVERSFTVAVPLSTGGGTGGNTHPGGGTGSSAESGSISTGSGSTTHKTATPTPKATISPATGLSSTPLATPSGAFPGASTSASPAAVTGQVTGSSGSGGGDAGPAVAVGVTLASLAALAFFGSWIVRRHLIGVMGGAARGEILARDASAWQRFWKPSGGSPPAGGGE